MNKSKLAMVAAVGLILASLAGCASQAELTRLDAKYEAAYSACIAKGKECGGILRNREYDIAAANNPLKRFAHWLGLDGGGSNNTTYVYIVSPPAR